MFVRNFQPFPTVENPAPSDTADLLYNSGLHRYVSICIIIYNYARTRKIHISMSFNLTVCVCLCLCLCLCLCVCVFVCLCVYAAPCARNLSSSRTKLGQGSFGEPLVQHSLGGFSMKPNCWASAHNATSIKQRVKSQPSLQQKFFGYCSIRIVSQSNYIKHYQTIKTRHSEVSISSFCSTKSSCMGAAPSPGHTSLGFQLAVKCLLDLSASTREEKWGT